MKREENVDIIILIHWRFRPLGFSFKGYLTSVTVHFYPTLALCDLSP
jgi:hypothetical protein